MNAEISNVTSREKSQQVTRDALIKAGAKLVAHKGYAGASVRDIANLAGYTQGAFYSNFQSKDLLVFAIMEAQFQRTYETLGAIEPSTATSLSEFAQEAAEWLQAISSSEEKILLETEISLHARRNPEFASSYYELLEKHTQKMTQLIENLADKSQVRHRFPVEQVARGMIAMARGLNLITPRSEQHPTSYTLRVFLEAVIER